MLYYIWVQRTGNACAVQTVLLLVFVLYRVFGNINKNPPPRTAYSYIIICYKVGSTVVVVYMTICAVYTCKCIILPRIYR